LILKDVLSKINDMSFSFILIGFTSIVSQIFILREFLIVFYGNEITLGIILFSWLLSGAIGSYTFSKLTVIIKNHLKIFNLIKIFLSGYIIFLIFLIRKIPLFFNFSPGEITGFSIVIISSFVILFLFNFLLSGLFVLGVRIYKDEKTSVSSVYLYESIGAFIGGILSTFLFLKFFNTQLSFAIIALLNLLTVAYSKERFTKILSLFLIFPFLIVLTISKKLNLYTAKFLFPDYKILKFKNTKFQNVVILEKDKTLSVFTNGVYNFSYPDPNTAEMNAHIPLLEHPSPKRVLLIGGGFSGISREILKHPIERLIYIELDKKFVHILKEYFKLPEDNRFKIVNADAINYFNKSKNKFDVIILNIPPPHTLLLNRFYTLEFFKKVEKHLNKNGIFCFSLPSEENYISEEQKNLFICLKDTLKKVFLDVIITPGVTSYFISSKHKNFLTEDWKTLLKRLRERNIKTLYFREYYLFSEFSKERFEFLKRLLKNNKRKIKINRDFYPSAYLYDIILFSTEIESFFKKFFESVTPKKVTISFFFILIILIFLTKKVFVRKIFFVVASTGFSEMAFQIITMLIFQIIYGYIFFKIALIFTSFMFGLILGTIWIKKRLKEERIDFKLLIKTQISILLYPLILILTIFIFRDYKFSSIGEFLIPLLPFIPGFIGGIQFPLASFFVGKKLKNKNQAGGFNYAYDLFGSCLGSILISLIFIPFLGIINSIFFVFLLNLIGYLILLFR